MTTFAPIYRLTVYAADGVTPLTPRAGAAHSDPFVVATAAGVAGAQPYLDLPRGRQGAFDPLTKKRTKGQMTFRLLDKRTGSGNLTRWATAFIGDAYGANQFSGARVLAEVSWDGGGSFDDWFTGRVVQDGLDGALYIQLVCRDLTEDLDVEVFVGAPHTAVASYAQLPQLFPLGLLTPYGDFPTTTPISGTVSKHEGTNDFQILTDRKNGDQQRTVIPKALVDRCRQGQDPDLTPQAIVTPSGGSAKRWLVAYREIGAVLGRVSSMLELKVLARPDGTSGARPAVGTSVTYYVEAPDQPPVEDVPLLVDDVHPITFLKDLAAGYFSRLNAGAVAWSIGVDASASTLEADQSFPPYRNAFTKTWTLVAVIEDVCTHANLGWDITAAGELIFFDLRRRAGLTVAATLTDADLVSGGGPARAWHEADAAIPVVTASYVTESLVQDGDLPEPWKATNQDYPDVATVRLKSQDLPAVLSWDARSKASGGKPREHKIAASGFRFRAAVPAAGKQAGIPAEQLHGIGRDVYLRNQLAALAADLQAPYADGPTWYEVPGRYASANVALVRPGSYAILDLDVVPDPATNLRGGSRLVLCTSRSEEGLSVRLRFLDCGASGTAVAPTIGTPTERVGDQVYCAEATVTLNASAQPARVDFAITATSVGVRPADDDPAWTKAADVDATGQALIPRAPMGGRLWVRARTEPQPGAQLQIPSGWVYPAGTGYVDLTGMTAPSAVGVVSATADTTYLTWANGDASRRIEIYCAPGAVPGTWTPAMRVATLDAGSVKCPLGFLTALAAATAYAVGVRHIDEGGGASAFATQTFISGPLGALVAPGFETGFSGSIDPFLGVPQSDGIFGMAVVAMSFPGWVNFEVRTETAIGAGTYGGWESFGRVAARSGAWTIASATAPNDRLRRQLRAYAQRDGASDSAYTPTVTVTPWTVEQIGGFPTAGYLRYTVLAPDAGDGATQVRAQVEWVDPSGVAGQVQLVSITANTAITSGTAAGAYVASGSIWKFVRPTVNGTGSALFRGKGKGGTDEANLAIPEVGNDAPVLAVQARILSNSTTAPTYRVFISHNGPSTATVTLSSVATGVSLSSDPGAFSVPSGTTVFVDYTVTIPTVGSAQGRAVWTAVATGYVKGQD
ncbi:MAG: hypothetical protein ACTHU0_37370, partial [Kofleriaceae bacterium]